MKCPLVEQDRLPAIPFSWLRQNKWYRCKIFIMIGHLKSYLRSDQNLNVNLLIIGVTLLLFGYLIGVKQRIELLTFVRNKYITDKKKVADIMGGSQILLGAVFITLGGIGFENDPMIIVLGLIILVILSIYVVRKYVD